MYIYYLNEASEDFNIESMYSNEDEQGFFAPDSCIIRQAPRRLPVMLEKQKVQCRSFLAPDSCIIRQAPRRIPVML